MNKKNVYGKTVKEGGKKIIKKHIKIKLNVYR